ncbi:MAG TPA: protein kinase [Pyrinomonadaceae bacterium]|nr:protein kinase [Pyrinomonadaceae bacterium]
MKTCPNCGQHFEDANTLCPHDGAVLKRTGGDRLVGQVLAGKYRVEAKLAEGGMGCVYRATHVLMEKTVAVKVLHPALSADDKIVARFTREAKAASRISHPHALTVTDFGESDEGVVFLVMEYINGQTLKEVIRDGGPMPLARAAEIMRQVSGALQAAHDQGVVHRDLKSDNIMLVATPDGDWAKVLDFGIAKITDAMGTPEPGLTAPNLIIGTPQYMSPEQCAQSSEIDQRSDIYSLGVILFEMLAGHVPFTGDSPTAIMMKHMQEPPPSILAERRDLPAGVGDVVERALAKSPDERFQTAPELYESLVVAAASADAPAATSVVIPATRDTDRIGSPTDSNRVGQHTAGDGPEELTVVSGEAERPAPPDSLVPPLAPLPEPASSFNPGRVVLYSIAALAVVFAAVFAFQRLGGAGEAETPAQQVMPAADGLPAQTITPPTGEAENDLAPSAGATPTAVAPGTEGGTGQSLPDPGSFTVGEPAATPTTGGNTNTNTGGRGEDGEPEPTPTPKPTPSATPRAPVVVEPDEPPPPVPNTSPEQRRRPPQQQRPRATPAPADSDQAGDAEN